jgi:hypothetical protein
MHISRIILAFAVLVASGAVAAPQVVRSAAIKARAALQLQGEARQAPVSAIQNPQDVTFVIAPKAAKSTFRVGEEIVLEFRLSSTSPRRYVVDQLYRGNHRTVRPGTPFVVEPTLGTVDPWLDVP